MKNRFSIAAGFMLISTGAFAQVPVATPGGIIGPTGTVIGGARDQNTIPPSFGTSLSDDALAQAADDYNAGKLPQATHELEALVKKDANNVNARLLLANAYLKQKMFAEAAPQLEVAIKKDPKNLAVRDTLGQTYLQLDKPKDAEEQFKAVLARSPKDATATTGLALALGQSGNSAAATAALRKAAESKPSAASYENLGATLQKAGKTSEAADAFRRAADLEPKNADAWLFAGDLYAQSKQNEKAIPALNQALTLNTSHKYEAHMILAQLYAGTDRDKAITEFKAAAQLRADDPVAWFNLGVLQSQAGQTAEAKQDYQKVLDLKPSQSGMAAQAQQGLDALQTDTGKK